MIARMLWKRHAVDACHDEKRSADDRGVIFPANNFGHFHPMPRQPLKHAGLLGDASPQQGVAAGMFNTHGKLATTVLSGCAAYQLEQDLVRRTSRLGRGGMPDVPTITQPRPAAKPAN